MISARLLKWLPDFAHELVRELGHPRHHVISVEFATLVWDLANGFELVVDADEDTGLATAVFCVEEERYDVLAEGAPEWCRSSWVFLAPRILDYGRQLGAILPRESGGG